MNPKQIPPPAPGIGTADIYHILFRRKWVILSFSLLGFIAAGLIMAFWPVPYESDALIYVNRVASAVNPDENGPNTSFVDVIKDDHNGAILNTECLMMSNYFIAKAAAEEIGPEKILASYGGGNDSGAAASIILKNLQVFVPKNTQVIAATFTCLNQRLAKPILDQIVTNYIKQNYDLHMKPDGYWDSFLQKEDDEQKAELQREDLAIAALRDEAGVVNIDEAMRLIESQKSEWRQRIMQDASEIASSSATRDHLMEAIQTNKAAPSDSIAATNAKVTESTLATVLSSSARPDPDAIDVYKKVLSRLAELQAKAVRYEGYSSNSIFVQTNMVETAQVEAEKKQLETNNPALLAMFAPEKTLTTGSPAPANLIDPVVTYNELNDKIAGLKASFAFGTNEMQVLTDRGTYVNDLEPKIRILERKRDLDVQRYTQISLKRSLYKFASDMGEKRFSNINVFQEPTPGFKPKTKVVQVVAAAAAGGIFLGLALAFLLEMFLDSSLKRPQEVLAHINLPFFLSLPYQNGNSRPSLPRGGAGAKLLPMAAEPSRSLDDANRRTLSGGAVIPASAPDIDGCLGFWDEKPALRPFYETLRDRLIAYFEMLNLSHRPKLVAVTGCHEGAGVSTIASGLACSLSETGEGNVLLVNMTSNEGDAHQFYKGKLSVGLDDLLEKKENARSGALVQDNLYVVKESSNGDNLPAFLPKRFGHLVTKMKASDYDYIIFDMPAVSQISITPRLARFMDMVLLVVESETTDRHVACRASALLAESRANVGVVMNKQRSYVPRRLHQEL